ncbi:MAG TPA: hypothetical protein HPP77_08835 [Candidatus Hydrogenedentes bacterium]|nr:hypothetical protein [Candidatus Hydrogenedentota bacterium]HIJ75032.1 hypothetical protein [Candidatus Hydrogenedentota bacterium]
MSNEKLRSRLLASETFSPDLKAKYDAALAGLLERRLKPHEKLAWSVAAFMGVAFAVGWFVMAAWVAPPGFPVLARVMWYGGSVFGICWVVFSVSILIKGKRHLKRDPNLAAGLTWGFMLAVTIACLILGTSLPDPAKGAQMMVYALVFLVIFGVMPMIFNRINKAELNIREDILRIELRQAQLAENIDRNRDNQETE